MRERAGSCRDEALCTPRSAGASASPPDMLHAPSRAAGAAALLTGFVKYTTTVSAAVARADSMNGRLSSDTSAEAAATSLPAVSETVPAPRYSRLRSAVGSGRARLSCSAMELVRDESDVADRGAVCGAELSACENSQCR